MKTDYIPKTEESRMIVRMASSISLALGSLIWLPGCTSLQEPYYGQNNYIGLNSSQIYNNNQNTSSNALRALISSAQGATSTRNGAQNFDSNRFLNNLSNNLQRQLLGNSGGYPSRNYNPYSQNRYNRNNRYNNIYEPQNGNFQVYNPNPAHRQAYLQRKAQRQLNAQYYNNQRGYNQTRQYNNSNNYNSYQKEPLYRRLPNGRFVPIE
jgi:hypothetical protein